VGARLLTGALRRLRKMRRVDAMAFVITAVLVLVVNAVAAVAIVVRVMWCGISGCACPLPLRLDRQAVGDMNGAAQVKKVYGKQDSA